jgi:hypothetical protein
VCDSPESKMTLGVLSKRVVRWLIDVVPLLVLLRFARVIPQYRGIKNVL